MSIKSSMLLCIAIGLYLSGCISKEEHQSDVIKLTISNPIIKDTTIFKEYVCQIKSIQHIELRALEKGYLQKIFVDEGQKVKKGQILFQILPTIYQAEVKKAEAEVAYANVEFQNAKTLADSNIVSKNELALAKAKLEKAKAELVLAQSHLGFTEIRAPFDGIIGKLNDVRLGSLLDEGELLTTLSDNNKMWVYFNLPETEYLNYVTASSTEKQATKVKLQLANNTLFDQLGIVETIEADFNNETGNIAFRATFNNPAHILRNGETGNILMPQKLKKALIIPQKATFEVLDKKFVYVVDEKGTVHSREIKIGTELPHLYVVLDGLNPADKILIEGLRKVKNGDTIKGELTDMNKIINNLYQLHAE